MANAVDMLCEKIDNVKIENVKKSNFFFIITRF